MKTYIPIVAICSLLAVAGCTDSKDKLNHDGTTSEAGMIAKPSEATVAIDLSAASIAKGRLTYQTNCAPCHGTAGKGDGPAAAALNPKPRDHTNGSYMNKLTNAHIFFVIRNGGASYGYPTMPAQPNLSDDEIKSVIAFVRSLSTTYKP